MTILDDWIPFHQFKLGILYSSAASSSANPQALAPASSPLGSSAPPVAWSGTLRWLWVRFLWFSSSSCVCPRRPNLLRSVQLTYHHWGSFHFLLLLGWICHRRRRSRWERWVLLVFCGWVLCWERSFCHRCGVDFLRSNRFRSCNWRCWLLGCGRLFPPCFSSSGRRTSGKYWWSSRSRDCSPQCPGTARRSSPPFSSKTSGPRSSRTGSRSEYSGYTPICSSGYTTSNTLYRHPHTNQLVQIVPEVVVVDQLHDQLDLLCVVLEVSRQFVKFLDDIPDLPTGFA